MERPLTTTNPPSSPEATSNYLHPSLTTRTQLTDALHSTPQWTEGDLLWLTALFSSGAGDALRQVARHDPVNRWYERLALTGGVEVWLLGWAAGQGTRPHGHGGAAGAYTVLDGVLSERYRDGTGPVWTATVAAPEGSAFGPRRVHVVSNHSATTATSVHAYSPPLVALAEYPTLEHL